MISKLQRWSCALTLIFAFRASATTVPSLTFEQLTDRSEFVVSGEVTRAWSAWDTEHKYIWTNYEISVTSVYKGAPGSRVVVSEPGGMVGGQAMAVAGVVGYGQNEQVTVFLERMPNGYLRTTGWGQGKYSMDKTGHLHPAMSMKGIELVEAAQGFKAPTGTSLRTLDGITVGELKSRVAARVAAQAQGSTK